MCWYKSRVARRWGGVSLKWRRTIKHGKRPHDVERRKRQLQPGKGQCSGLGLIVLAPGDSYQLHQPLGVRFDIIGLQAMEILTY